MSAPKFGIFNLVIIPIISSENVQPKMFVISVKECDLMLLSEI